MLPTLENSEKFKTEYNSFNERINKIAIDGLKTELKDQLNKLLREVRAIDAQHMDLFMKKQLPNMAADTRNRITEIRSHIMRRLDDYERSVSN
jgi:hypothetical protein